MEQGQGGRYVEWNRIEVEQRGLHIGRKPLTGLHIGRKPQGSLVNKKGSFAIKTSTSADRKGSLVD